MEQEVSLLPTKEEQKAVRMIASVFGPHYPLSQYEYFFPEALSYVNPYKYPLERTGRMEFSLSGQLSEHFNRETNYPTTAIASWDFLRGHLTAHPEVGYIDLLAHALNEYDPRTRLATFHILGASRHKSGRKLEDKFAVDETVFGRSASYGLITLGYDIGRNALQAKSWDTDSIIDLKQQIRGCFNMPRYQLIQATDGTLLQTVSARFKLASLGMTGRISGQSLDALTPAERCVVEIFFSDMTAFPKAEELAERVAVNPRTIERRLERAYHKLAPPDICEVQTQLPYIQ